MTITIYDTARFIHDHLQQPISQMKLYKLLWFCQGWHYGILNKPLFNEDFEAWRYGPVSRDLWWDLKGKINLEATDFKKLGGNPDNIIGDSKELVKEVLNVYGNDSATELVKQTHLCDPWIKRESKGGVIPQEEIRNYFQGLARKGK